MTEYVVDASVVIQRLIRDNYSENVKALFRKLVGSDELIVPEFCILECANVLWKQVRFHQMPPSDAELLVTDLVALPLKIVPANGLVARGLQIGLAYQLAVYDSIYIALAEQLQLPLISIDTRQQDAALKEKVTLKPITDFR